MAKGMYPTKVCPNCGEMIHARSKSHPACGWVMEESGGKRGKKSKKAPVNGRRTSPSLVSYDEIAAVKKLVESMGAEKVQQLARVFGK